MGTKHYMHVEVTSNLDAAIALARTLYDMEHARIYEAVMTPGVPAFHAVTDMIWKECYHTLNNAARIIGYDLDPIANLDYSDHWVEIHDFYTNEAVGCWDGHNWIRF